MRSGVGNPLDGVSSGKAASAQPLSALPANGLSGPAHGAATAMLNLAIDAKAAAQLGDTATWSAAGVTGDAIRRRVRSVYFDTDDRRLARRGLSLSVRSDDGHHVQTLAVRAAPENGAGAQEEWQGEITTMEPQPDAVEDPDLRERLGFMPPGALKMLFATEIEREERIVEVRERGHASLISVALDRGEISAGAAAAALSEVELRLLQGSSAALYRLALALLDRAPMTLEAHSSKAERGFALLNGTPPPWTKASALALDAEMSVEDGMVSILSACFDHFLSNQAAAADGRDPEGVHQFRVALRRLRSALTTFKAVLPAAQLTHLQQEARWSIQSLNPARDWDVFLDEMLPPVAGTVADVRFAALKEGAKTARAAGYEKARTMLRSAQYTRLVLEFALWLAERGWRREATAEASARLAAPIAGYAGILLDKRHKTARKRGKGFDAQSPEERHRLRIALKKLRYVAEFFRSLYPGDATAIYLDRLKSLQDTLGHLNDVATAERLIGGLIEAGKADDGNDAARRLDLATAGGRVLGWYAHGVENLEPEARRDWKEFKTSETFW